MRVAVVGLGRMGQAVIAEAADRGHSIVARIGGAENAGQNALTRDRLGTSEVAIEFTRPNVAAANVERLIDLGIPVVTGTTGWLDSLPALEDRVRQTGGSLLHAANFSIGLQLMIAGARAIAGQLARHPAFDAQLSELHHRKKLDAPSGTALALQRALRDIDPSRSYEITSQRIGSVPGTHRLLLDAAYESVELSHVVRDRRVFAAGAVTAADWLIGRRGVFTFEDLFNGASS